MTGSIIEQREIDLDVLGSTVRLSFPSDEPDSHYVQLREAWSGARTITEGPDATLSVTTGESNVAKHEVSGATYESLASNISTHVTLKGIELARGRSLMLHAAGIAMPDGRVIAFVAPSGAGKTTLASVLGKHFGYVSDETVLIERDLTVRPYRKPLSVIENPAVRSRKTQIAPKMLGLKELPDAALRLAAIVLFYRGDEHESASVSSAALPDAVNDLSGQISYFGDIPDSVAMLADIADKTGGIRILNYRDCESVVDVIDELLAPTGEDTSWRDVSASADEATKPGTYTRSAGVVAVETNDTIITMYGTTIRVLAGLSPVIWDVAKKGATLDEIQTALVNAFGEPEGGDSREIARRAVETLVDEGMLLCATTAKITSETD